MKTIRLMEVCGTHTMQIARCGIRQILPENVELLSGPGCPVCVTAPEVIDALLRLSEKEKIVIATYGDLLRVPGSQKGDTLNRRKAEGASVKMVYSSMDALKMAEENPDWEVVFPGIGFETTAPGTAAVLKEAKNRKVTNFSVFSMLKRMEPVLRKVIQDPECCVDGFLCPGHVAAITGTEYFRFLTDEYRIPAVIAGFEAEEILEAVKKLLLQIKQQGPRLENAYQRVVREEGNLRAQEILAEVFDARSDLWRGFGSIPESGFAIRPEFEDWDAEKKFDVVYSEKETVSACRCGEIIRGKLKPMDCPLFGKKCTPDDPEGPCMVSSEGACAAAYKYRGI